jgi:5-methylthioribose kinase
MHSLIKHIGETNMDYKKEEIKEYFDDYINDNKEWFEENSPNYWKDDLHHNVFNTDYYIIGTYQAKQWLGDMAFNVIEFIKEYEQFQFGEVFTDLSDPEKVVNMYAYIIGEEIVNDYLNELEEVA